MSWHISSAIPARTLSTTKTRRIAVVSEELTNPYYPALIEPLRQYLSTQGLRAVILPDTDHEEVTLEALADGSYDGVILTTTARDSTLPRDLTERGIAHVLVNRVLDHAESHSCTVDNVGGMAEVARLMAELRKHRDRIDPGALADVHRSTARGGVENVLTSPWASSATQHVQTFGVHA